MNSGVSPLVILVNLIISYIYLLLGNGASCKKLPLNEISNWKINKFLIKMIIKFNKKLKLFLLIKETRLLLNKLLF